MSARTSPITITSVSISSMEGSCSSTADRWWKAAVTLDHVSNGRAELALGAGGSALDRELAGPPAQTFTAFVERVVELLAEESLQPRPVQTRIPLTIGGHGETLEPCRSFGKAL